MTAPTDLEEEAGPVTVRTINVVSVQEKEAVVHPAARRVAPLPGNYGFERRNSFLDATNSRFFPTHSALEPLEPQVHPHAVPRDAPRETPILLPALRHTRDLPQARSLRQTLDLTQAHASKLQGDDPQSAESREREVNSISGRLNSPEVMEEETQSSSTRFTRSASSSRVTSFGQASSDESWRCKNFEKNSTLETMKVWPQVI